MLAFLAVKKSAYDYKKDQAKLDREAEEFLHRKSRRLENMIKSHEEQEASVGIIKTALDVLKWEYSVMDSEGVAEDLYLYEKKPDLVIAAGGDGTVLRTAQYLKEEQLLGVRTDSRSIGYLCGVKDPEHLKKALEGLGSLPRQKLNRLEFLLDGKQVNNPYLFDEYSIPLLALNEGLYCNENPAMSNQYEILLDGVVHEYKSSGLIIATATGSTGIIAKYRGEKMNLSDDRIQYVPRSAPHEKPKYADSLTVRNNTHGTVLIPDGSREMITVPEDSVLTARKGLALTMVGRIRD